MKSIHLILLLALGIQFTSLAQNWKVFNANYRYNYKFNNSGLVSQVIFADSTKTVNGNTEHYLNRIGVVCNGNCPTLTQTPTSPVVIVPNMPQFLQRKIVESSYGSVSLRDTAKIEFPPSIQVNQTWLFDSVNTISATCINVGIKMLFGIADSVKTVLVGSADTLVLSKQFGIVQFPELYNKNKYYLLVGIENSASYDSTALYGEKVPNDWDFARFKAGTEFMYRSYREGTCPLGRFVNCYLSKKRINTFQILPDGFHYSTTDYRTSCDFSLASPPVANTVTYSIASLSGKSLSNRMYPGQIISTGMDYQIAISGNGSIITPVYNIVRYSTDTLGNFVKSAGYYWGSFPSLSYLKKTDNYFGLQYNSDGTLTSHNLGRVTEIFVTGIGSVMSRYWRFCDLRDDWITGIRFNGQLISGDENFVSIKNIAADNSTLRLYPNPFSSVLNVQKSGTEVSLLKIQNVLGQVVREQTLMEEQSGVPTSDLSAGIYLVTIIENGQVVMQQKLVKE
jgi:hypothetical protein